MNLLTINPEVLEEVVVPLGVCVVLPCLIVFLVMWARRNEINRKTEVALKAIESGQSINPEYFSESKKKKSVKNRVFGYLKAGLILSFIGGATAILSISVPGIEDGDISTLGVVTFFLGLAFIVIYFLASKHFAKEIKAEEDSVKE